MRRSELVMRRRSVDAFIRADPVSVQFERLGEVIKTLAGGSVRGESKILPPQQCRIVHNTRRYFDNLVNTESGEIPDADYLLICRYTIDVAESDVFWAKGSRYKVLGIHPFRDESILCSINFDGGSNVQRQ